MVPSYNQTNHSLDNNQTNHNLDNNQTNQSWFKQLPQPEKQFPSKNKPIFVNK